MIIYKLTNTVTHKIYIGKSCVSLHERIKGHMRDVDEGASTILHQSIRKHGWEKFTAEIIFEAFEESFLNELEIGFIKEFDCCILDGKDKGYNMTRGGDGFSSETAKALSVTMIQNGTHPWAGVRGSDFAKQREKRRLENGTQHLVGNFDLHSKWQKERVNAGTHNFQGSEGSAKTSAQQKKLVAEGKHILQGDVAKARHQKMLADGTHPGTREYFCPHCNRTGKGNRFKGFHFEKCKAFQHK